MRTAPRVTRKSCRGCGCEVDTFTDEIGIPRQLDTIPPPFTLDLARPDFRRRVWEDRGPRVGWCLKFSPTRSWREIRLAHKCEPQHKNKKENKR